ncbi:bifunctional UDP-N-acetylmuramoyl-L-alanyl-D-glutamate--2,6-diaminopimelate ligase MurE/UDP-N-acetylmuramoyl-tripeptide--D-alanyl-D-alanine ligase MurF [Desulfoprunum benzoelyticum]|uniref:Multifunctional fusion protein n=1 Tax=Desulfoprunum benzoelyticum TaxID=1506996 RepID=A0A840USC9_9BACT|nr:bifunctional UDP-N-acetylmuramoyl-L-alanyl-D-glutamate--2,6-diaminopimelate ligase MurE/UDP-N-acetylmuramoyl-tripeptide--D-alanyl-D-alanine ligase MurF [Desulfoprunum benzoelyticum]MBB5347613.1 murE/murF fusion protein [Desulfoprunum benzoelyticum]MBM9529258.1 bifunctional UDP-N-acetylmuramoyl-L-alanyl-D-glutamate--2,6-diaminopimelate ligase MurE/UDP-N-acetylmuramoyl-tripeptide--D-alanyl-D-alanine ligase MurF [Desulfoprunum benzoelyticum]
MTGTSLDGNAIPLVRLLDGMPHEVLRTGKQKQLPDVIGITADSRRVVPGSLFVAVAGTLVDGHAYIDDAIRRGCAAVVVEQGRCASALLLPSDACVIAVDDSKEAYAEMAEAWYGHPSASLQLIGITGTNGKTTITYLLEEILSGLGYGVGVIGTVNYRYTVDGRKTVFPATHTTPDAMLLQELLRRMADAGVSHVIMEVSSHALAQSRIGNLHFDVAAFTNLTRDHLDYHADMYEYFETKTRLFTHHLKATGNAVIGYPQGTAEEGGWSGMLALQCRDREVRSLICGAHPEADLRLAGFEADLMGNRLTIATPDGEFFLHSPLVGRFNADNVMVCLAVAHALGIPTGKAVSLLSGAQGAPGRLQRVAIAGVDSSGQPVVLVDYAHTPDALEKVLAALAALPHRQLFCVFGCGGDRDTGKRPVMGGIAAQICDVVIVTDDNPRSERPEAIREQVASGVAAAGTACRPVDWLATRNVAEKGCVVVAGRGEAIALAIRNAGGGDIVLIAGKGHEQYQLVGGEKRFFDDCLQAKDVLSGWTVAAVVAATGVEEPEMSSFELLGQVATDSRAVGPGDIFVAIEGERFDGHDFIGQVVDRGAGCLVVARRIEARYAGAVPQVVVNDTQHALGDLANYRRRLIRRLSAPVVIGLTGSCGKTTVKEMTAAILARHWPPGPDNPSDCVLKTAGNFNNLIGMPVSLLPLSVKHRAAVIEMGMNRPGEIERLAAIAEPDISCITNIHAAHLEGLQSIEGVARAKEELFAGTAPDGVLVVNADDPLVRRCAGKYRQRQITFGLHPGMGAAPPDFWATGIAVGDDGRSSFTLHFPGGSVDVRLRVAGQHNVTNALAAAALAWSAGADGGAIAAGLGDFRAATKRMETIMAPAGYGILNDTYNANPASMAAALRTLAQMRARVTAAILGDMLELGDSSEAAHREVGRLAAECRVRYLGLVGDFAGFTAEAAGMAGMGEDQVRVFADKEQAAAWIKELERDGKLGKGDWLLVKASRGLKLETVVASLTGKA